MSLIDKFRAGYTETERAGLVSSYNGTSIDVNMNLTPSDRETVYGPIVTPPPIEYDLPEGPSADTQALIDRFQDAITGLGEAQQRVIGQTQFMMLPYERRETVIYRDRENGDGFDLGSFGGGLGLGAVAALVLMLALGSKK